MTVIRKIVRSPFQFLFFALAWLYERLTGKGQSQ